MKAVSPLLAVVLLIGIVMAVAGTIFLWIHGFAIFAVERAEEQVPGVVECAYGWVSLINLQYCKPWLGGLIYNRGTIPLTDLRFQILYKNLTTEFISLCSANGQAIRCEESNLTVGIREQMPFNISIGINYTTVRLLTQCPKVFDDVSEAEITSC